MFKKWREQAEKKEAKNDAAKQAALQQAKDWAQRNKEISEMATELGFNADGPNQEFYHGLFSLLIEQQSRIAELERKLK